MQRRKRLSRVPKEEGRAFWSGQRWARVELACWRCEHCGKSLIAESVQLAHVHPLGMGRSRYKRDAECSWCGTVLNSLLNLKAVCSSDCNTAVEVRCKGKELKPE